jgi:Tol biopolymer transport system component
VRVSPQRDIQPSVSLKPGSEAADDWMCWGRDQTALVGSPAARLNDQMKRFPAIWTAALSGCAVTCLLFAPTCLAAFPGGNGPIAFDDGRDGGIAAINPHGADRHRVTTRTHDDEPTYSPDGARIAFDCLRTEATASICTVNANGSDRRRLTPRHGFALDPAFSPDGTQIVYSSGGRHTYSNIWVMNAGGSHRHELIHTPGNDWSPSYSPDGTQIVFERVHQGIDDISVAIMNADGSGRHDLTSHPRDDFSAWPDFSPDGKRIVYASFHHDRAGIWLMKADGSDEHELTPRSDAFDLGPVFSPNGRQIAFDGRAHGFHTPIYLMNTRGGHIHRLPNTSLDDAGPAWGPRQ